jgi:hypothetical protein
MDIFTHLKRMVAEPKVYALTVESSQGQVLYLGVHFSLEEAHVAARDQLESFAPFALKGDTVSIDLWNIMPARQVIAQLIDPSKISVKSPMSDMMSATKRVEKNDHQRKITAIDQIEEMKETKNNLMKKLIEDADISQVEKAKKLIGTSSYRYVVKAIEKKHEKKA